MYVLLVCDWNCWDSKGWAELAAAGVVPWLVLADEGDGLYMCWCSIMEYGADCLSEEKGGRR